MTENKRLKKMQKFLESLGLESKINSCDGKLYCLDIKEYLNEIIQKSEELEVIFTMEQTPYYGPLDPHTSKRDIVGFSKSYYFKDGDDDKMIEKHKVLIELENTGCYNCIFLNSSNTGENCSILRKGIQEGKWSNIDFQFDRNWRYKNCPLLHEGYLCRSCGIKVIMND